MNYLFISRLFYLGLFTILFASTVYSQSDQHAIKSIKDDLISTLPIIIIETEQNIPDEPKIGGFMRAIDNGPGETNHESDSANNYYGYIGIEIRGQSTQLYPKKSYSVETRDALGENRNVSLLGLPVENDWVLYAPYSDKSMLRNYISFYIGRQLRNYASRTRFCEVIVNGDYKGLYILMEKIKKDNNRVNIADLNPLDLSGDELTGGYIIRVDKLDGDFVFGNDGWKSYPDPPYPDAMNIIFQYFHPKADDMHPIQKNYIRSFVTDFENNLTSPAFANPNTGYNSYINTTSFVDQMLLNEISKEVDKYRYSTYFYKEKITDGGKLFAGPPWDFNFGYSNVDYWPEGNDYTGWLHELVEPYEWGIMFWWKRLMESTYFRNLAYNRWFQLREDLISNAVLECQIDSIYNLLNYGSQERNYERWPILGTYVWPNYDWQNNDYTAEVTYFRNWLFDRLQWIDENIEGEILNPEAHLSGNFPLVDIDLTEDYFSRDRLKPKFFKLLGDTSGLKIDSVVFKNASSIALILSGQKKETSEIRVKLERKILNSYEDLESNILTLGLNESNIIKKPKVFESNGNINIVCDNKHFLGQELRVYNMLGQLINIHYLPPNQINSLNHRLNPGIYLINLTYKQEKISYKLYISTN
jgi:hypothetical protein